jgi:hypothetical protein
MCYDGSLLMAPCASANTGDAAPFPRQDGRFGRDAMAAAGKLPKIGGGAAGFDYTKIANDGSDLDAGAVLGTNPTDWACTRDNITGLTWEVKTSTDTDLRYFGHSYAWYSTNAATNGGDAGGTGTDTCNGTLPSSLCNTEAFVTAVNATALCGHADWRMPTPRELLGLVHAGAQNPSIDASYFPNSLMSTVWSGSSYASDPSLAWFVNFFVNGGSSPYFKSNVISVTGFVRLVRGGQF